MATICHVYGETDQSRPELRPANIFGDHMVLQRDLPVPVWGTAEEGESVTVQFAGHRVTTHADKSGRWKVELPALAASADGRPMTITGSQTIVFEDVLVGEVWVCSGQSNMQYGWGEESDYPEYNWGGDADLAKLAVDAKSRPIRCFHVKMDAALQPKEHLKGEWSTSISGSAVAFGFSYYLQEALDIPVAVIVTAWGSSSIEGWMPLDLTEELPHFKTMMEAFFTESTVNRVNSAIAKGVRPGNVWLRRQPNILYNAMLHPLIPYACRGFLWYQGEANAAKPDLYAQSLPLWIQRLRKGWGREDMHFMVVMLPGFGVDSGRPDDARSWAEMRDAQLSVLKLPDTSVVNTIDLGAAKNIHPADKEPISRRAALLAREEIYHHKVIGKGPFFKNMAVEGNTAMIAFANADGLHTTDGEPPKGFWLAAANGEWYPATAEIRNGNVILTAADVPVPKACRYAFCGTPDVNLVNSAGLPAYSFKTD